MNLIRIFLVAWLFEHPSMADSVRGLVEGDVKTLHHQNESFVISSPDVIAINASKFDQVVDSYPAYKSQFDECFVLCNKTTSLTTNNNSNVGFTDGSVIWLNRTIKANNNSSEEVYCNCGLPFNSSRDLILTKRATRSVELPFIGVSSRNTRSEILLGEKELKEKVSALEKDLTLLLNDPSTNDERNERLYTSDNHYSDILVAIPKTLSDGDDLLPEQFDHDAIVETENLSVPTDSLSLLTEDLRTLEDRYFGENISLISVLMEDENVFKVPSTFTSTESEEIHNFPATSVITEAFDDQLLSITTIHKFETSKNLDLQQMNSSRFRESDIVVNSSDLYSVFRSRYPVDQWKALGYFDEDYLELINKHWLQFQPPYHRSFYILAGLYAVVMTVGVTGNCLVIFMFIRCRSLRTPANVLVMNLALSDFFLLAKMPIFIFNCFHFGPALGAIGCEIYGFLGGLTGTVSIMTLAAIALDRYYVIVYPLDPLQRTSRQRARLCVALVWCYGCVFASLPLHGFSRYVPEGYLTSCSFDYLDQSVSSRMFILVFFVAAWVVPFSVITFCYIRIYRVVISGSSGASSRRGQEEEKRKTEIRLAGVIMGVIGLWFLAWTPYAIVALLGISGNAHLISPLSSMIPALFCKTASCLDPYVYAVTHPRFRREFQRFFCNKQARRRFEANKTQCWKTETSQIPGMMIGIRHQKVDYSLSEEDIEEMVVMVDNRPQKTYFTASTIAPEEHNLCEITFPPDSRTNEILQHPSWFMPPQPLRDRSTSLKLTGKSSNKWSHPTSV